MIRAYTSRDLVWVSWHVTAANSRKQLTQVSGEETSLNLVMLDRPNWADWVAMPICPCTSSMRFRSEMLSPNNSFMSTNSPAFIRSTSRAGIGASAGERTTDCLEETTGVRWASPVAGTMMELGPVVPMGNVATESSACKEGSWPNDGLPVDEAREEWLGMLSAMGLPGGRAYTRELEVPVPGFALQPVCIISY